MALKPRVQVRDPNAGGIAIRPQARVVDNFRLSEAQAPVGKSGFAELAGALKDINPSIQGFLKEQKTEIDDASVAEGVKLFNENKKGFAEAVRSGIIPAGANPHLQRGYRLSELKLKGHDYSTRLQTAWASSEARNQNDPDVYQKFVQDFTASYTKENLSEFDPTEVLSAFQPSVDRTQSVLQSQHTAYRIAENERIAIDNVGKLTMANLDALAAQGIDHKSTAGKTAIANTGAALSEDARELVSQGISGKKANEMLLSSTISLAVSRNDAGLLAVLDHVKTGTGTLSQTADARKAITAARTAISAEKRARENHAHIQRGRQAKKLGDQLTGQAMIELLQSGGATTDIYTKSMALILKMSQTGDMDPQVAKDLMAMRATYLNEAANVRETPEDIASLYNNLDNATDGQNGYAMIARAAAEKRISASTVAAASKHYSRNKKYAMVFNSDEYKQTETELNKLVTATGKLNFTPKPDQLARAFRAKRLMRTMIAEWAENNPKDAKSPTKRYEKMTEVFEMISRNPQFKVDGPVSKVFDAGHAARIETTTDTKELAEEWTKLQGQMTPEQWVASPLRKSIVDRIKAIQTADYIID